MVTRVRVWCVLTALLGLACGSDARCKPIAHCDVRKAKCQTEALKQAICLRDRGEAADPVEVEVMREDEYEEELLQSLENQPETEEEAQVRRGLSLLGLAEARDNPAEDVHERVTRLGGYFDLDEERIVIIDHGGGLDTGASTLTLVHEMVHALQHRAGDLEIGAAPRTFDDQRAASALIEGEATLWTDEAGSEGYGSSFRDIDYERSLSSYRASSRSWIEEAPAPIERVYSAFSYSFGASYLWPLLEREGATAVAAAFADPPHSSFAVMEADPWRPDLRPNDLGESAVPELELTLVGTLHLGRFMYEVFAELDEPTIELPWYLFPWGDQFIADTVSVFASADDDVLITWRLRLNWRWLDVEQAARELAALNPHVRVSFEDQDIWLIAAEDADLLEDLPEELSWTAAPEADFGYEQDAEEPEAHRISCLHRGTYTGLDAALSSD